jgi:hypothetical protein
MRCTIWLVRHRWGCRLSNQWRRAECIAVGTLNILEAIRFSGGADEVLQCDSLVKYLGILRVRRRMRLRRFRPGVPMR